MYNRISELIIRNINDVILNPIEFDKWIPIKFQNMIKFKSIGSFINLSIKFSKKFDCLINSSLSHAISNLHFIAVTKRFQTEFLREAIKNNPTK